MQDKAIIARNESDEAISQMILTTEHEIASLRSQ
jgi:hypothetical protein